MKSYEQCAMRLEDRGGAPPSKEYVDRILCLLKKSGVEALVHSAVDPDGRPLYPSKVIKNCHSNANFESFQYLIDSLHQAGIPVLSWYPLNKCHAFTEYHPEWTTKPYTLNSVKSDLQADGLKRYPCFNSPYGTMLPELALEIVRDVGYDGLWFDGATMTFQDTVPVFLPGCRCDFCRDRFKKDTAYELPESVNFDDRVFRIWLNWRYDVFMGIWKSIVDRVTSVKPEATICFNNYRRRHVFEFCWTTAIPMRKLGLDMEMSGELDNFCNQADFQIKMHKAYQCKRGAETWWPMYDNWRSGVPDVETLPAVQATLGAISAGGSVFTGVGLRPDLSVDTLFEMEKEASRIFPFKNGRTIEYAAILCSQRTQDFYGRENSKEIWNEWHGANEACRQGHVQSSIIFDDYLNYDDLVKYPVAILGNAVCLSKQQAEEIEKYVHNGGSILACHRIGERDELGFNHKKPVLDDLLGIRSRKYESGRTTLVIQDGELEQACGKWVSFAWQDFRGNDWLMGGEECVVAEPDEGVESLAGLVVRTWNNAEQLEWYDFKECSKSSLFRRGGLWTRRVGKGAVAYTGVNIFETYLNSPTPRILRFITSVLKKIATPGIEARAPMCVTMNCRVLDDGQIAIHLHNSPGSTHRYPFPVGGNYIHAPAEVIPLNSIEIKLNEGTILSAKSWNTGQPLSLGIDNTTATLPSLYLHDVVLLEIGS